MEVIEYCTKSKKEDGLKCISCLPLWSQDWLGTVALCCAKSRGSIYDILACEEKIQIQNLMHGFTMYISLLPHCVVQKSLSQGSSVIQTCLRTIRLIWQDKLSRSINFPVLIKASFYKNAYNTHNFQESSYAFHIIHI